MNKSTTAIAKHLNPEQRAILEQIWKAWEKPRYAPDRIISKVKSRFLVGARERDNLQNMITVKGIMRIASGSTNLERFLQDTRDPKSNFMLKATEDWFLASCKVHQLDKSLSGTRLDRKLINDAFSHLKKSGGILGWTEKTHGHTDCFNLSKIVEMYRIFLRETHRLPRREIRRAFQDPDSRPWKESIDIFHRHIIDLEDADTAITREITGSYADALDLPYPRYIWDETPPGLEISRDPYKIRLEAFARKQQAQEVICGTDLSDLESQIQDRNSMFWKQTAYKTRDSLIGENRIQLEEYYHQEILKRSRELLHNLEKFLGVEIQESNREEIRHLAFLYLLHEDCMQQIFAISPEDTFSMCNGRRSYQRFLIRRQQKLQTGVNVRQKLNIH